MNINKKHMFVMVMSLLCTHTFFYGAAAEVSSEELLSVFVKPFKKLKDPESGLYICDEHCYKCAYDRHSNRVVSQCKSSSFYAVLMRARPMYVCGFKSCPPLVNKGGWAPFQTSDLDAFVAHSLKYGHPEDVRLVLNYKTGRYENPLAVAEAPLKEEDCEESGDEPAAKRKCVSSGAKNPFICGSNGCQHAESTMRDLAVHRWKCSNYGK